jgi:hypothetical protein
MRIYPRCHPYWDVDGEKITNNFPRGVTYSAKGYLMPCCWSDSGRQSNIKDFDFFGFFEEALRLENVDNIDEILMSEEWMEFHRVLLEEPEHTPRMCRRRCGKIVDPDVIVKV